MKWISRVWGFPLLVVALVGCQSPKFTYETPPQKLNSAGPSILILPIMDQRTNKAMDKVLEKGYWADVQQAMAAELASMGRFKSVAVSTNGAERSSVDFKLSSTVKRLEWEIPDYGKRQGEAFMIGLLTGVVGGSIYLSTGINVNGHAVFLMQVDNIRDVRRILDQGYSASVTNRFKKVSCDVPATKSKMMSVALQEMMRRFKADMARVLDAPSSASPVVASENNADAPTSLNTLTAAEEEAGWRLLFDGKTTQGWRGYGKKEFPKQGWVVEDGCLKKVAGVHGGDIVTEAVFEDFELSWEWKLPPKANNGVKYLVVETRPSAPGHEYQMVDDTTEHGAKYVTASFYAVLPPGPNAKPKPMGEWNASRILVRGNHVEHWLNGEQVLAYELGSAEVKAAVAKSKFKNAPGFGEKCTGLILLTDHHDEAWFRNVKVREFPPEKR